MRKIKEFKRIRTILIVVAIIIAFISLFVSQSLVKDLSREEHSKMELFADAYRSLDDADENTDLGLVLAVISGNKTIPVIVVDESGDTPFLFSKDRICRMHLPKNSAQFSLRSGKPPARENY